MTSTFSVSQKISSRHLTQTRRELKALSSNFTFVYQSVTYKQRRKVYTAFEYNLTPCLSSRSYFLFFSSSGLTSAILETWHKQWSLVGPILLLLPLPNRTLTPPAPQRYLLGKDRVDRVEMTDASQQGVRSYSNAV